MQVASRQQHGQLLRLDLAEEDEARQVTRDLSQRPLLEALAGELVVPAVIALLAAGHGEQHVGALAHDPLGDAQEQVEAAHRLQAASDIGDQSRPGRQRSAAQQGFDLTRRRSSWTIQLRIESVEVDFDARAEALGEGLPLPVGRRVAGGDINEIEQRGGVDAARIERGEPDGRQIGAIGEVPAAQTEVIFAVADKGTGIRLLEKQRRSQPHVSDYQVGPKLRPGQGGVADAGTQAEVIAQRLRPRAGGRDGGVARHADQGKPFQHLARRRRTAGQVLYEESAAPAVAPGQFQREPAELGGEGLVNEEEVHGGLHYPAGAARVSILKSARQLRCSLPQDSARNGSGSSTSSGS